MSALPQIFQDIMAAQTNAALIAHRAQVESYIVLLKKHDWLFAYSDDSYSYRKGFEQRKELEMIRREIDRDYVIWNEFCHVECKNGAKSC
jgi:hypothetical protein